MQETCLMVTDLEQSRERDIIVSVLVVPNTVMGRKCDIHFVTARFYKCYCVQMKVTTI